MGFAAVAGSLLASCRSETSDKVGAAAVDLAADEENALSCTDVSNLTEEQIQTRKSVQYVDDSPNEEKQCNNCRLFEPPDATEECGGCQVVPGPIHPQGYCTSWVSATD